MRSDFTDQSGTGTAIGLAGAQLSLTNQYGYRTSYEVGLWGDVKKYLLDINSGVLPVDANGNPLNAAIWSAATQVDAQAAVTGSGPSQIVGWDVNRKIVTINDQSNAVVPFRLTSLSTAQQTSLVGGWTGVTPAVTAQPSELPPR
jgi:Tfp pilus tip-associated adhesin PilY1